ncbi:MAG: hypothetical protein GX766_08640 [Firmicutes bacterium]|nr:hypothetical protein [Bacillota bacterium]
MAARKKDPKASMITSSRSIVILSAAACVGSIDSNIIGKTNEDRNKTIIGNKHI